jgi:predicted membrane protein
MIEYEMRKLQPILIKTIAIIAIVTSAFLAWMMITVVISAIYCWNTRRPSEPYAVDFGFAMFWFFVSIPLIGILMIVFYEFYQPLVARKLSQHQHNRATGK